VVTKAADMGKRARKPVAARAEESGMNEGAELPERLSVQGKTELVLRLLGGGALDTVSRESQIPAHELESWKSVGSVGDIKVDIKVRLGHRPPQEPTAQRSVSEENLTIRSRVSGWEATVRTIRAIH
jgi:hypothetical protein